MSDISAIQNQVRDYLTRQFMADYDCVLTTESDLFEAGVIDSYGFIELVSFLEKTFGISLSDDDLASTQMSSLQGISQLVAARSGSG